MREHTHYAWNDNTGKRTIWVLACEHKQMLKGRFTYDTRHFTRFTEQTQVMDVSEAKTKRQISMLEHKRWLKSLGLPIAIH